MKLLLLPDDPEYHRILRDPHGDREHDAAQRKLAALEKNHPKVARLLKATASIAKARGHTDMARKIGA